MPLVTIEAEPQPLTVDVAKTALVIIDMQRDFLEPGGFGEALGNDVSRLAAAVAPCRAVLKAAPRRGILVIHTREGHRPDLYDAPPPSWSGAPRACALARRAPWAAFSSVASRARTSSPRSIPPAASP